MFTANAHSRPAAPNRVNEDWYAVSSDLFVVLDGATIRTDTGCVHGLPWYVRNLGNQLLDAGSTLEVPLPDAIASAIKAVASMHSETCDLSHPGTPSAAVGVVRRQPHGTLEYAVLGDIAVMFSLAGQTEAHFASDTRVSQVAQKERRECDRHLIGTAEKDAAMRLMKDHELAGRNVAGGYWIASVDPEAASHAFTGELPTDQVTRFAICSDGAMRALDGMTSLNSHNGVLDTLRKLGPARLVDMVRSAEERDHEGRRWPRNKVSDDATVVYVEVEGAFRRTPPTAEQQQAALERLEMFRRPVMGEFVH